METPAPEKQACAYLAHQLVELYLVTPETGRLEVLDRLLDEAGIANPKDRDTILRLCDRVELQLDAQKKDLARLLLRCPIASLDDAAEQLRLTFG
jgi:hypothetical protein